ncbi:MAG: hypothetical protein QOF06_460 [Solirubrobacterales bacterium]|jgi:hypothetical protein|nr:hypothetical protein [Solirubrobacterales bacterium]
MGWDALENPQWEQWLLAVAGGGKVATGQKLDPFGSSWRTLSTQAKDWLVTIKAGKPIPGKRRNPQAFTDLGDEGLVDRTENALTPFGEAVLERWRDLPAEWEYELPLALALLQEGAAQDAGGFRGMLGFWWDVRRVFDEEELFSDEGRETLMLLSYVNQGVGGFNPWVPIREEGEAALSFPWDRMHRRDYDSPAAEGALSKLKGVLDPSRRAKSRIVFCRAMSLMFEDQDGKTEKYLKDLELPQRYAR